MTDLQVKRKISLIRRAYLRGEISFKNYLGTCVNIYSFAFNKQI